MSSAPIGYRPVATLDDVARGEFLVRVYQHLVAAIGAFVLFEALLFNLGIARAMYDFLAGASGAWLLILGGFMIVNWLATSAAHDVLNPSRQYLGLFGMAAAEALIFAPFLYYFFNVRPNGGTTVVAAALITVIGFAGLTGVAMVTRRDLSFIRPLLMWGGVCALVLIAAAVLFGLNLGVWFSVAMIALAGGSILYSTQNIMRRYPYEAYVGASVQLFASVMMLFWYVLRLLGQLRG
jgi:FtsH-binding integral membrane protein